MWEKWAWDIWCCGVAAETRQLVEEEPAEPEQGSGGCSLQGAPWALEDHLKESRVNKKWQWGIKQHQWRAELADRGLSLGRKRRGCCERRTRGPKEVFFASSKIYCGQSDLKGNGKGAGVLPYIGANVVAVLCAGRDKWLRQSGSRFFLSQGGRCICLRV